MNRGVIYYANQHKIPIPNQETHCCIWGPRIISTGDETKVSQCKIYKEPYYSRPKCYKIGRRYMDTE